MATGLMGEVVLAEHLGVSTLIEEVNRQGRNQLCAWRRDQ